MNHFDENCIFCKLANGSIPTLTVYEDNVLRAIMDIAPANKGHIIILPKIHASNIFLLDDEFVAKAFILAKKLASAIQEATGCDGVNILQNNGSAAGQTVFHFHVHVIPRFKTDDCNLSWLPIEYKNGEAEDLAKKISAYL